MVSQLLNTIHSTSLEILNFPTAIQKFNNTNADSAEYGEESRGGNGQLNVKVTCRMDPV